MFYFSVSCSLIDSSISSTAYRVYLALIRNLGDNKSVSYEELAHSLDIDKGNVEKYIRELAEAKCILVQKKQNSFGKDYNHYIMIDPDVFNNEGQFERELANNQNDIKVCLLL